MIRTETALNKSALIDSLSAECDSVNEGVVNDAVRELIEMIVSALIKDGRVEIRGFGSFCLHHRQPRKARNPRTGEHVQVGEKAVPYFKPGKLLREIVNDGVDLNQ